MAYSKEYHKKYRENRSQEQIEQDKLTQKKFRQSDKGIRRRNISHWNEAKIREPEERWESFYENKFVVATNCALCNVEFGDNGHKSNGKCLDHHHHSGYIRNIVCRKCNVSPMVMFDKKMNNVLLELHRAFHLRN